MKDDPPPPVSPGKSPHERFVELGTKVMAVSRAKVADLEKTWHVKRSRQRKKKR